jgi:hypothetical protein
VGAGMIAELLNLDKVLHKDVWSYLHPATKILVKALQHIRDKVKDGAEVRIFCYRSNGGNMEVEVTTYKSRFRISVNGIEFHREKMSCNCCSIRVQKMRIKLSQEAVKLVETTIRDLISSVSVDIYDIANEFQKLLVVEENKEETKEMNEETKKESKSKADQSVQQQAS